MSDAKLTADVMLSAAGDRDYFQLGLGGASNLTVSLSLPVALTGPGRVNISLLDANGRILTYGCTAANGTTASLTFTNVPQTAYVMVGSESYTGTSCSYLSNSNLTVGAYSISLTATQIGGAGLDPIFEPNNTIATATPLASGQTLTAALSAADDRELIMDIMKYGSDCQVIEPAELQTKVAAELQRGLMNYRG